MTETGKAAAAVQRHYAEHDVHGYTQGDGRLGFGTETLDYKGVTLAFPGGDGDCSSGNIRSWRAVENVVGKDLTGWASYTGDIKPAFLSTGYWEVWPLSRRGEICPGDLYLTPGHHVAMAMDKNTLAEFWTNEYGGALGGKPGDQTGYECMVRGYYDYPWDCIMHYKGPDFLADYLEDEVKPEDIEQIAAKVWEYHYSGDSNPANQYDRMVDVLAGVDANGEKLSELLNRLPVNVGVVPFGGPVYRLVNTSTGAHTLTTDPGRCETLVRQGWTNEGEKFQLGKSGDPVWCLVHPDNGEAILTTSHTEAVSLATAGWISQGVIGTTGKGAEVHRFFNQGNGYHLFTSDPNEASAIKSSGWKDEGVAFRAV